MIMSTVILAWDNGEKIRDAIPGLSGMRNTEILASSLLYVTPETSTVSISASSFVTKVPGLSLKLERTWITTLYFLANSTERICSTFEPREAISSISS